MAVEKGAKTAVVWLLFTLPLSLLEGVFSQNGPQRSRARRCCAAKRTLHGEDRSEILDKRERGGPKWTAKMAQSLTASDRHEAVALTLDHLQQREEHWAIVDLMGKGGHVRTVPVPDWVKSELEVWLAAAGIDRGRLFRRVNKVGKAWGEGMTVKAVWHIVKERSEEHTSELQSHHDLVCRLL